MQNDKAILKVLQDLKLIDRMETEDLTETEDHCKGDCSVKLTIANACCHSLSSSQQVADCLAAAQKQYEKCVADCDA